MIRLSLVLLDAEMDNLIDQGIELAVFGMGTVFVFLALLVFATKAMSSLILRFEPEMSSGSVDTVTQNSNATDKGRLVAIISAAIAQHRHNNK